MPRRLHQCETTRTKPAFAMPSPAYTHPVSSLGTADGGWSGKRMDGAPAYAAAPLCPLPAEGGLARRVSASAVGLSMAKRRRSCVNRITVSWSALLSGLDIRPFRRLDCNRRRYSLRDSVTESHRASVEWPESEAEENNQLQINLADSSTIPESDGERAQNEAVREKH
jgi:hypothetical protein